MRLIDSYGVGTFLWHQGLAKSFYRQVFTVFKLFWHHVNASKCFATVTFFIVFKMCRHRLNAVLDHFYTVPVQFCSATKLLGFKSIDSAPEQKFFVHEEECEQKCY